VRNWRVLHIKWKKNGVFMVKLSEIEQNGKKQLNIQLFFPNRKF
jgi:hypothetical protein